MLGRKDKDQRLFLRSMISYTVKTRDKRTSEYGAWIVNSSLREKQKGSNKDLISLDWKKYLKILIGSSAAKPDSTVSLLILTYLKQLLQYEIVLLFFHFLPFIYILIARSFTFISLINKFIICIRVFVTS